MLDSKEMAKVAYDALDEKLGKDIRIIKIDEISVIADYLIIANGQNSLQIAALTDNVEMRMAQNGVENRRIEGNKKSTWILMDYGDVIVHVFSPEDRLFYDLERIWRDGRAVEREELG
ncbi:MAG: ribosome silencing factor [Roseburia sp.]|nr:ribosome silencing factor [Roseburia sp.]